MAWDDLAPRDRSVITWCAGGAFVIAFAAPFLARQIVTFEVGGFADSHLWLSMLVNTAPTCLALVAAVLTAHPFVGVKIAAGSAVLSTVALVVSLSDEGLSLGFQDYGRWLGMALLLAGALLAADLMARQLRSFTASTGAQAGLGVAGVATTIQLVDLVVGARGVSLSVYPRDFWLTQYVGPFLLLVAVGWLAGAAAERRTVSQETAGRA